MDALKRLEASIAQTRPIVAATARDSFGQPTPCTEWDVKTLLNHLVAALVMFRDIAEKGSYDPALETADLLGADPAAAYDTAATAVLAAWSKPGKLDQPAAMPWGPMPADLAISMLADDVVVHGWDLAKATGQRVAWDDVLVEDIHGFAKSFFASDEIRANSFAPPVPVPDDAPAIDRLVGFLGRTP